MNDRNQATTLRDSHDCGILLQHKIENLEAAAGPKKADCPHPIAHLGDCYMVGAVANVFFCLKLSVCVGLRWASIII